MWPDLLQLRMPLALTWARHAAAKRHRSGGHGINPRQAANESCGQLAAAIPQGAGRTIQWRSRVRLGA